MGQVKSTVTVIENLTLAELSTMQTDLGANEHISATLAPFSGNLADLPLATVTLSSVTDGTWVAADTTVYNTILGKHDGA
jgi:hypothetical protein